MIWWRSQFGFLWSGIFLVYWINMEVTIGQQVDFPGLSQSRPDFTPNQQQTFPFGQSPFYYPDRSNLYPFGPGTKDSRLEGKAAQTGAQVQLYTFFPYYGARYNYSIISVHGYITFGHLLGNGLDFLMGEEISNWPEVSDPATIAVYACGQREATSLPYDQRGLHYRVVFRSSTAERDTESTDPVYLDRRGDALLDQLENDLRDGMVGAQNFHAFAALIVTWENVTFVLASNEDQKTKLATYQAVFMTDQYSRSSYVILNYHTLGYAGADISGQSKLGRCKALFNGGNQTGVVQVDPLHSKHPTDLALKSAVPHRVRGRYLFRVDDIVRRGGCSNLTSGTYRMTIYPDVVNSMGDVSIQLNGPCLSTRDEPVLQIAEFKPSRCIVKNAAIVECKMIRYFHWGTKQVFLKVGQNKAYVGSIYYVPPGLDPFQLKIGSTLTWFSRQRPLTHVIKWYPGNLTNERGDRSSSLRLALWGYTERRDDRERKFVPLLKKIALVSVAVPNVPGPTGEAQYQFQAQALQWIDDEERNFWSYRFGFLRLYAEDAVDPSGEGTGIWSPPISLHFWWGNNEDTIEAISRQKCLDWYNEEGHQWNLVRDTETNSSCPCRLEQAEIDIGRYMPHPRCSQKWRDILCDAYTGAKECFLSAQNVRGHYVTHYGQVCCYDGQGYLMQTSYQSVVQVENYPYSPGFPQRAYEFGTYPFTKQFEIPVLSNYYHDVMPYFFCCKWVSDHCQFFYWRRPSSGCQNYQPPGIASVMGAGHFITVDGLQYIFNEPGTYVFLHKPAAELRKDRFHAQPETPEVLIEVRLERYPNRLVDFSNEGVSQYDLVQPLNVSVVTGVAVQEGSSKESDRVVFTLRKDTRRFSYRINVLVNDELRYFDQVTRQKYRGVIIYINDIREGQSEIYAALEKSRIGIRVRESYAVSIADRPKYEESYGLLDVLVSLPPEYLMRPDHGQPIEWEIALAGLVGTFTNAQQDDFVDPTTRRPVGSSSGSSETVGRFAAAWQVDNVRFPDLFTLMSQDHQIWPESSFLGPVYPASPRWSYANLFVPQYDYTFQQSYAHCQLTKDDRSCPEESIMADIERTCLQMTQCRYDYFQTRQSVLATQMKQEWTRYNEARAYGTQKYNSCGAINIEYPEYLVIDPPSGRLYLEGHTVHFDCYQDHWIKGGSLFKCEHGGWTKGSQPWCRSKRLENTQKILAIVFGISIFVLIMLAAFMCCYCVNKSRQGRAYRTGEPLPFKEFSPPKTDIPEQEPLRDSNWERTKDFERKVPVVVDSHNGSTRTTPITPESRRNVTFTPTLQGKKTAV